MKNRGGRLSENKVDSIQLQILIRFDSAYTAKIASFANRNISFNINEQIQFSYDLHNLQRLII